VVVAPSLTLLADAAATQPTLPIPPNQLPEQPQVEHPQPEPIHSIQHDGPSASGKSDCTADIIRTTPGPIQERAGILLSNPLKGPHSHPASGSQAAAGAVPLFQSGAEDNIRAKLLVIRDRLAQDVEATKLAQGGVLSPSDIRDKQQRYRSRHFTVVHSNQASLRHYPITSDDWIRVGLPEPTQGRRKTGHGRGAAFLPLLATPAPGHHAGQQRQDDSEAGHAIVPAIVPEQQGLEERRAGELLSLSCSSGCMLTGRSGEATPGQPPLLPIYPEQGLQGAPKRRNQYVMSFGRVMADAGVMLAALERGVGQPDGVEPRRRARGSGVLCRWRR